MHTLGLIDLFGNTFGISDFFSRVGLALDVSFGRVANDLRHVVPWVQAFPYRLLSNVPPGDGQDKGVICANGVRSRACCLQALLYLD